MQRVSGKQDDAGYLTAIGAVVRARRLALGVSQEALAHATGIDRSHMGRIERGERNLSVLNLVRIASALEVAPSSLLMASGL
ncbi:transcriptional regulator with XRE-family HTH domain [Cupriavidus metallidurans]|jgi:transcriptional regulator with XRE-family HTH domain|uniref:helix-turn-helix domain-containing protein n=1 Tax=Cupriavidus TaxID=106589 RepID=UPI0004930553|nr:helix-turn-helix transcriptional regulator [Cupriavidus metallidurans]MDE4917468.1 helix-turn-helix transcriptional regulator [Cupriavidus metallidurans]